MSFDGFLTVATVMLVATVTPGPNNLLAMRSGTRGVAALARVITGVVLGGIGLFAIVWLGGAALFELVPQLRSALAIASAGYLIWLGVTFAVSRSRDATVAAEPAQISIAGTIALQLINPKSWLMALAVVAMPGTHKPLAFGEIVLLCIVLPAICLSLWAALGAAMTRWLTNRRVLAWFNGVTGGLFIASAIALLLELGV
jgi:threonine/homoserine/homoserine lactone efflux protein